MGSWSGGGATVSPIRLAAVQEDETGKRKEGGEQRGRLAQGPCLGGL